MAIDPGVGLQKTNVNRDCRVIDHDRFSKGCVREVDKAMGLGGVHLRVLKELGEVLVAPLTDLFNASLELEVVPEDWRRADVVPLHKIRSKEKVGSDFCAGKDQRREISEKNNIPILISMLDLTEIAHC
uniref:Ubiquitin-conjugating enzyme E2 D2 isoform X2 n=1 Tax=Geotrypetes seraphini TaxID=260995 RepID=A0A6P8Q6P8_GEOSA|nr:ubiquitin-conjugating enzyme E2 D2 isoform X2 [Geotrypetes seraphini]